MDKASSVLTVKDVRDNFVEYSKTYYGAGEAYRKGHALELFVSFIGSEVCAEDVGPLLLESWRDSLCKGRSVGTVNAYVGIVRAAYRWHVLRELVSPGVSQGLESLPGLRPGRSEALVRGKTPPVAIRAVQAIYGIVSATVWDMVNLQLLTAARPGELVKLRVIDVRRVGEIWTARVEEHKNAWRQQERVLYFGPNAIGILRPYLLRPALERIFPYSVAGYRRAVNRACKRAGVAAWHPHQLRHTAATQVSNQYGPDAARVFLGHVSLQSTLIYIARDDKVAKDLAALIG